jgi:hypothetical protein
VKKLNVAKIMIAAAAPKVKNFTLSWILRGRSYLWLGKYLGPWKDPTPSTNRHFPLHITKYG